MIFEILFVLVLVAVDQTVKLLTLANLANPRRSIDLLHGVFELTYVENTGAAFGIFEDGTLFLSIIVIIVIGVVLYFKSRIPITKRHRPLHICLLFIIAGAIGNLIDRIRLHFVVDMFHFYWFEFPVFNVADIYVTCSAVVLMLLLLTKYRDLEI